MRSIFAGTTAAELVDGPYAWFRLAVSMLLGTVGSVGLWSVVIVLPEVQAEFAVNRADASLPYTLTMVGFAIGNALFGRFVDRFAITVPIFVASIMLGAGYALAAASSSIWQFALVQGFLIGIGTSVCFGPLIADVSHWFRVRRGVAVAATATGNYLAGAIWPTALQGVLQADGWRTTYVVIGVICFAVMAPLAFVLRRRPPDELNPATAAGASAALALKSINLSPGALQILLVIAGVGCCVAMSMPQVHIVAYCADLGYGVARGAQMLSLMLAGGVFSRLASGFLADRIGGVKTLLIGSVGQGLALVLYMPFDGLASLYAVSLIFGLAQGGIVPSYAMIVREYLPAKEAGQRVGLVIMATVFGMALGGWLSGYIYDLTGSYRAAFLNGIAWNLLNIAIMLTILGRAGRPARLATA
jgi:MFS family permease